MELVQVALVLDLGATEAEVVVLEVLELEVVWEEDLVEAPGDMVEE